MCLGEQSVLRAPLGWKTGQKSSVSRLAGLSPVTLRRLVGGILWCSPGPSGVPYKPVQPVLLPCTSLTVGSKV